jgi:hyperosmotically inducible periplasmic protein
MIFRVCAAIVTLMLLGAVLAVAQPVTDNAIIDNVRIKLAGDPIVKGGALEVEAKDGVVTLSGNVEQEKQKDKATKLAKKVKGVKQVVNNITVQKHPGR